MLGGSTQVLNLDIARCLLSLRPKTILEYGCGEGKLGGLMQMIGVVPEQLTAVQKLFTDGDRAHLAGRGYTTIHDRDILEYVRAGLDRRYDMIAALDVIEHFFREEAFSIIDYSLYNCDYFLLVWPSRYPQNLGDPEREGNLAVTSTLDVHRTSFELSDIAQRFDVVYYIQANLADNSLTMRYHVAVLRGHMNMQPLLPPIGHHAPQ